MEEIPRFLISTITAASLLVAYTNYKKIPVYSEIALQAKKLIGKKDLSLKGKNDEERAVILAEIYSSVYEILKPKFDFSSQQYLSEREKEK